MVAGLRLTGFGLGLTDLRNRGGDVVVPPSGDFRNQILMTYTYTLHAANAFPGLLIPPAFGAPVAVDFRDQILSTYTYTLHSANAFPGLLIPGGF